HGPVLAPDLALGTTGVELADPLGELLGALSEEEGQPLVARIGQGQVGLRVFEAASLLPADEVLVGFGVILEPALADGVDPVTGAEAGLEPALLRAGLVVGRGRVEGGLVAVEVEID